MTSTRRNAFSCDRCAEWFYTTTEARPTICPVCDGQLSFRGPVERNGYVEAHADVAPCDDQCTQARGTKCDCQCGGFNHGSRRTVRITWATGRPRFAIDDDTLARARAERLPKIIEAEQLAEELRGELRPAWQVLRDRRNAGEWLSAAEFAEMRQLEEHNRAIRKAMALTTPAGRLRALRRIRQALDTAKAA